MAKRATSCYSALRSGRLDSPALLVWTADGTAGAQWPGWFNHLIALTMGAGMGLVATRLLRVIGQREADSLVRSDDLIGMEGVVTLAMDAEQRGFVELSVRGTLLRRPARVARALAANTKVIVVASDDHTLRVETLQPPAL